MTSSLQSHHYNKDKGIAYPDAFGEGRKDFRKEFLCAEESARYSDALKKLVFSRFRNSGLQPTVIEFGSGSGVPVVSAIIETDFLGVVHGYEINAEACTQANKLSADCGLEGQYTIHPTSFFECDDIPPADYLIANPPYIPCQDESALLLPTLCGGIDGNAISKKLLSRNYKYVFLEVSSYSNPIELVAHALTLGYRITNFIIEPLPFGIYSNQPIVKMRLHEMKKVGKAFFSTSGYLVGSAFFSKASEGNEKDLSLDFLSCLTSTHG